MPSQNRRSSVKNEDVIQGQILWLPPFKEMPAGAVKRIRGKGPVEEGMFDHPLVVCSRPAKKQNLVQFHLITSFRGKKLNEIYGKSNKWHRKKRTHYLPISPTPAHPDGVSAHPEGILARNPFPTLALANGSTLRWNSYVNVVEVFEVDWSLLQTHSNPNTPGVNKYRLDKESLEHLHRKSEELTKYVPGPQFQPGPDEVSLKISSPLVSPLIWNQKPDRILPRPHSADLKESSLSSGLRSSTSARPTLFVQVPEVVEYGSVPLLMNRNAEPDGHHERWFDAYISTIGAVFLFLLRWSGKVLKHVYKTRLRKENSEV